LARIYRKLEIHTRAELGRVIGQQTAPNRADHSVTRIGSRQR
jgi:hypothetical protein